MDLTSKTVIKDILDQHNIFPKKKLGQNFLISRPVLEKIIETANIKENDIVLEIGPGIGTLTLALALRAQKIIAIEKDERLVGILKETLKNFKNIEIIQQDILKIDLLGLGLKDRGYKVVANLPYYIASAIIKKFLEAKQKPEQMVLMVQKEVAQRICEKTPNMNMLAVFGQLYSNLQIITKVSRNSFWPQPKVESAILKITPQKPEIKAQLLPLLTKIIKHGFAHPRKQIINNLSKGMRSKAKKKEIKSWLQENNISPSKRPQELSVPDWIALAQTFNHFFDCQI